MQRLTLKRLRPFSALRFLASFPPAASQPTFLVSEIFSSIQGEGPHTGRPSVFLRLATCNLSCAWCDTPYTWLFSAERLEKVRSAAAGNAARADDIAALVLYDKDAEVERVGVSDLIEMIVEKARPATGAVVITGGEPLVHARPLYGLVTRLRERGFAIEFETNGTLSPGGIGEGDDGVHFNVSAKLSNSCVPEGQRIKWGVLGEIMSRPSAVLKFVVTNQGDVEEAKAIVDRLGVGAERVFLMPEGKSAGGLRERGRWIVHVCRELGWRYSHRVHVELWGDVRGV